MTASNRAPFWRQKTLAQMSRSEWESLCDGCGKCCLHKVRRKNKSIAITNVACRLLDVKSCQCSNYPERKRLVDDCVVLEPDTVGELDWLPSTCAYRLVADGKDLPSWHPLKTRSPESVHRAGISVRGRAISERDAGTFADHIVAWPDF